MLPNEVRPGRNHREMHRLSQWRIASFSERESTSESSESRSMTEKEASYVSSPSLMNYPSIIASRRDSPAFDKTLFSDVFANNDSQNDDSSSSLTMNILIDSSTNVNNAETGKNDDENSSKDSRCKCRNFDTFESQTYSKDKYRNVKNFSNNECENDDGDNVRWTRREMSKFFQSNRSWQAIVSLILIALVSVCSGDQCAIGIKTPGRTFPHGDIVLEYGQSLRILCMLNKTYIDIEFPGKNSSDLVFFRNKNEIEPEYMKIVNETTVAMYVEKPPPASDMYYCKLKLNDDYNKQYEAVCLNKVVIGFKPQEPENFTCVSYNWENLTCSWDPFQNYVHTDYSIAFKLLGRPGGRKLYPCPKDTERTQPPNTCFWDTSTNPIYRQPHEYYTFILNVSNVFGVVSVPYKFHHYAHVIPAKPADLSVVNKTSDSALLHWNVPFPMQNFPPGLHHRVTYQHQWEYRKTWRVINITSDIHTPHRYFNLTQLDYANAKYDVRVFMKSALAIGEDKWSQFSDVTFRTAPKLPGLPPRTDIGSFEIVENNANRDVFLYWQAIPPYLENGDNFKYQVSHIEENGRKLDLQPSEITRTYAKFKGISFNSFRFEIVATNIAGANKQRAKISVPSRLEMVHEPLVFTKIAFDGGLYELSWKPPLIDSDITNYTIFWCNSDRDRPYPCSGYLDWVNVPKSTMIYNVTVPEPRKVYQFAISANTGKSSSGMVWALCTVIHNRVVGKMKSVWINHIGSDYIKIGWKLECSDRIGIVEGFNIYYCPIVSPYNLNCKGEALNTTIRDDKNIPIDGIVRGLKPYTTYKLTVAVLTKNGEGLHSDPQTHTTLEAAPSTPPKDVKVTNVTNSTMVVSWNPPAAMNGVLLYYEIHYNSKSQKIDEGQKVTLRDLHAHTNYSVSVAACTVSCSEKSPAIYRLTDIGRPGKIFGQPRIKFINSTQVEVSWDTPQNAGGFLDYFQIWSADGGIQNSTKTVSRMSIPDCRIVGTDRLYEFRVRAINMAPDGTHLEGPWSETGSGSCYSDGPSFRVWVIIWIISSLSGLAFLCCLAYTSKRMWLKCKAMQDVEVKLPPGLAPNMKLLHKVGEQHIRQSSADSSGCSSGQESVTSSLTSDSHVSSDSGADVDPVVNPPVNKLLDTPPSWEASSLRQRNVGTTRPVGAASESPRWESYVKVAKTGEPIIDDTLSLARSTPNLTDSTGYPASPHAWSSTGYISMPSSEELSSNPSPVSKETINPSSGGVVLSGGYSVVGVVPKPILRSPKNDDRTTEIGGTLMSCKANEAKAAMSYVSLASLEQKFKEKPTIDTDNIDFPETNIEKRDNTSKPYVQTGLLDTMKKPLSALSTIEKKIDPPKSTPYIAAASFNDAIANKPFATTFSNPRTSKPNAEVTTLSSKPYVAVGWMADLTAATSSPRPNPSESSQKKTLASGNAESISDKPYVTAATAFRGSQQRDKKEPSSSLPTMHDVDDEEASLTSSCSMWQNDNSDDELNATVEDRGKSVITNKRAPSYVTVGENPRHEHQKQQQQQQQQTSTTSPYVQHSRFEKQMSQQRNPVPSTTGTTTDERYSKVSVVPNTIQ